MTKAKKTAARDLYMAYRAGWIAGATGCDKAHDFVQHSNTKIRDAYLNGHDTGTRARGDAGRAATCIYGYDPLIAQGEP